MTASTSAVDEILEFWFGDIADDGTVAKARSDRWWKKDPAFDQEIRDRFSGLIEAAAAGELDEWRDEPRSALALVILCDQFTRNSFRDTGRAFAYDQLALAVARAGLASGYAEQLRDVEAYFLFMPFMHSEEAADQAECVRLFEARAAVAEPAVRPMLEGAIDYARRHQAIVDRFGRFPHRNAVLGRPSSAEELGFLEQPGSSF